jgi:competence protein ComGC
MNANTLIDRPATAFVAALVILTGCQKQQEGTPSAPAAGKPAMVSAEKTSFDQVAAKLDPGGNFYLYLSTEKFLGALSTHIATASNLVMALPNVQGEARKTVEKCFAVGTGLINSSGISQISGLGLSSIARAPGFYYNKVILHHYAGQGAGLIWSLFGQAPHPMPQLDLLPESVALASASDFDVALLWSNILQAVKTLDVPDVSACMDQAPAKFRQWSGLDLDAVLHSLSGEYGIILTLDQHKTVTLPLPGNPMEIPSPALCLLAKVNSDLIFDRVDKVLQENPATSKLLSKVDETGLKMRTVTIPVPIPVEVRPTLARLGDYLLLASSDTLVREIAAVKSGQKKGYKATEEFKKLSQGVPAEGNNFDLVTSALGGTFLQIQERSMAMQKLDPAALNTFHELFAQCTNNGSYSVGLNGPEGWEGIGNGASQGAAALVVPAAAAAGLLAAVAIPNFVKARATSQQNACINNLRLIDSAKQQWALEQRKQSADTPAMSDLKPYLGFGPNGEKMPSCPAGGVYKIGAVGEKPTCSLPGHELP